MEKFKLIEKRKTNGFSQSVIAEKLCMDVSNYNRRERGQVRISLREWEKLADILQVPIEEIYESDDTQVFICRDSSTVHYQGTNNIYSVPEYLLDTQRKYIERLENEIRELRDEFEKQKI
ncbi:hypothetical protein FACS189451_03600 [Bacteroidia bacterium]|nr:hypothetical protein FACS189451_03600 [Bacteroidia bacterium]